MEFEVCPSCKRELAYVKSMCMAHRNGDGKSLSLYRCKSCQNKYSLVSLHASRGYSTNDYKYLMEISTQEALHIERVINRCPQSLDPHCKCLAHKYMNSYQLPHPLI